MPDFKSMSVLDLQIWYRRACERHGWRVLKRGQTDRRIALQRCIDAYNTEQELQRQDRLMAKKTKGAAAAEQANTDDSATSAESKAVTAQTAAAAEEAEKAKTAEAEKAKGKRSKYSGTNLWYVHETNKRQAGSWGNKGMQIIIDQPGISYEDFVKAGGRTVDLAWDVDRNNVVFSEDAMTAARAELAAAAKATKDAADAEAAAKAAKATTAKAA